jgi:hypothetical protein
MVHTLTDRCALHEKAASSLTKYVPPATRWLWASRPFQVAVWSPAGSTSLRIVRTRRPATS